MLKHFQVFFYRILSRLPRMLRDKTRNFFYSMPESVERAFIDQVLAIPIIAKDNYIGVTTESYVRKKGDPKLLAYYLPQFHPFEENDNWWGRGTTEWNNVSKAVPQYVGHYQPRLPGELGYYDLRIVDNIKRQVELAKIYGVYGFCFYYYWFDPTRLLEKPLDMFIEDKSIDFPFCLCWANESWAKRFWGTDNSVIMEQPNTIDSYKRAIFDMIKYFKHKNYIRVDGACKLIIYKPSNIPSPKLVIDFWREEAAKEGFELHLVGVKEFLINIDLLSLGFDALTEFQPGSIFKECNQITNKMPYIRNDYAGIVLDYADLVINKRYKINSDHKTYRAIMPMWDNTARKNNKGYIFHGSSPKLYKEWLEDIIHLTKKNKSLTEPFIFINAWNEWGEGAYMEPDSRYGYAYLETTKNAIIATR